VTTPETNPRDTVLLTHSAQNHCFGCGVANSVGLHLKFAVKPDHTVLADPSISSDYEGPPGCLHGGIIATLLDEAMSKANRARGVTAMTRHMQVDYLHPVPSGAPIHIEARVSRSEGRKNWTEATIQSPEGKILARASGLFIRVNPHSLTAADPA